MANEVTRTSSPNDPMTKGEREELGRLSRNYVRLGKQQARQRSAELLANFEETLAAQFDPYDIGCAEVIAEAVARFEAAKAEVATAITASCEARGIPKRFRPSFSYSLHWADRGENATASRRTELRNVAKAASAAAEADAVLKLETEGLKRETALARGQLRSYEARAFLASMPSVEQLMPDLAMADIRRLASAHGARTEQERRAFRAQYGGYAALPAGEQPDDDDGLEEVE